MKMRLVERQERTVRMPQDSEMGKSLRAEIGIFFVSPFFILSAIVNLAAKLFRLA